MLVPFLLRRPVLAFGTVSSVLALRPAALRAQALPDRYRADVFPAVTTTSGLLYGANVPHVSTVGLFGGIQIANEQTYGSVRVNLRLDLYQPQGDTLSRRPAIIFCFGGGFVNGQRTAADMVALAQGFARRGYVTACIDYRLGMNLTDPEKAKRAVYRALQDGRAAVRFLRRNARLYRLDPEQIFIAGHSAGGFIAYHNAYLDRDAERPASTRAVPAERLADLGPLDGVGDNQTDAQGQPLSGKANAVLGFAGALGELAWVEGPTDVPVALFHSRDDNTVPFTNGRPFSFLSFVPGINLPLVYGGSDLAARASAVGAPNQFFAYTNRGHSVHYDAGARALYADIVPRGSQFLYERRLQPAAARIEGASQVCATGGDQLYRLSAGVAYGDWQVLGGSIVARGPANRSITVRWNPVAAARSVSVTPYSRQLAQGSPVTLSVALTSCAAGLAASVMPGAAAFAAYPSPTAGPLQIQLPAESVAAASQPKTLRVLDQFGQEKTSVVLSGPTATTGLDLSSLPAGTYYVQLRTADQVLVQRVVKQ